MSVIIQSDLIYLFSIGIIFLYSLMGVLNIAKSTSDIFLSSLSRMIIFELILLICFLYFFDFSKTSICLEIFLFIDALKREDPINPHPIINNFLNIFKYQ